MWNGFCGQPNLYSKCKAALKKISLRMQLIMKKRKAMQKFLKTDIADLLKNNLDYNAYGRAEGLYIELNLSSCYDYVQDCCNIVTDHLKAIHKERECPNECRVAVASLIHAASRFSDLPELRDVRAMFNDKYGDELHIYVSKEFVQNLKSNPPTMEMKFELMKDIGKEVSIAWDPTSLQHKLNKPIPQQVDVEDQHTRRGYKLKRSMSDDAIPKKEVGLNEGRPKAKSVRSRFIKGEEDVMDQILRHYSTKPGRKNSCTNGSDSNSIDMDKDLDSNGCKVYSNHLHPKMPDCDDLAGRIEALRKT